MNWNETESWYTMHACLVHIQSAKNNLSFDWRRRDKLTGYKICNNQIIELNYDSEVLHTHIHRDTQKCKHANKSAVQLYDNTD